MAKLRKEIIIVFFVMVFLIMFPFSFYGKADYNWSLSDNSEGYVIETSNGLIPHFYENGNKVVYETNVDGFSSVVMKIVYNGSYMYNYMVILRISNDSGVYYSKGFGCVYSNWSLPAEWQDCYNGTIKWTSHRQIDRCLFEVEITLDDVNIDGMFFNIINVNKVQLIFMRNFIPQFTDYQERTVYYMTVSGVTVNA